MNQQRDAAPATEVAVARMPVIPVGAPSEEQLAVIRSFGTDNTDTGPESYFVFEMIASSDGVDFYATRPRVETSLIPYVADLKQGQSLLASHDIRLLPYGSSFDGRMMDADPQAQWYEGTFFRKWDRPELRTTKVTVGEFFIPRGLELNGQSTDDLINAIRMGAIRKASISFTVGTYVCSIDGENMLDGWGQPLPEGLFDPEAVCQHFPGEMYDGQLAYAWMDGNQMVETSMVYKNAAPSSLLISKAEQMAEAGMLTSAQIGHVEARLMRHLPAHEKRLISVPDRAAIRSHSTATSDAAWDGPKQVANLKNDAGAATYRKAFAWVDDNGDPDVKGSYRFIHHFVSASGDVGAASTVGCSTGIGVLNGGRGGTTIPSADRRGVYNHLARHIRDAGGTPPELSSDSPGELRRSEGGRAMTDELEQTQSDEPESDEIEEEEDEETTEQTSEGEAHPGHSHSGKTEGGHKKAASEDEEEDEDDEDRMVAGVTEARQAIATTLGIEGPLTDAALQRLAEDAKLGREMYAELVDDAVKARVRAVGQDKMPKPVADKYRDSLLGMRDPEYVLNEIALNDGKSPFKAGRQVRPADLEADERENADVTFIPPTNGRTGIFQPAGAAGMKESDR